jgi:hypothetical protein
MLETFLIAAVFGSALAARLTFTVMVRKDPELRALMRKGGAAVFA